MTSTRVHSLYKQLYLPLTAVHFSKQNSTFVVESNLNLKISKGEVEHPLPLPLLRAWMVIK